MGPWERHSPAKITILRHGATVEATLPKLRTLSGFPPPSSLRPPRDKMPLAASVSARVEKTHLRQLATFFEIRNSLTFFWANNF